MNVNADGTKASPTKTYTYWQLANIAGAQLGWHPLFVYSQWQLESGNFTSPNLRNNNNLAGQTWTSQYPESMKGTARPRNEGGYYVKYNNAAEGYVDFVKKNSRYNGVKTKTTPEEQAKEVARSGWAVDPNYANSLIRLIGENRVKFAKGDSSPIANVKGDSSYFEHMGSNVGISSTAYMNDLITRNGTAKKDYDETSVGAVALFNQIQENLEFKPMDFDLTHPIESSKEVLGNVKPFAFRTLIVLIGLLIIIFSLKGLIL
jgi:hypothetical protein